MNQIPQADVLCQCHKCNNLFKRTLLSSDPKERHMSPCCEASYSTLDRKLDRFFLKFLDVNYDEKYYEY